MNDQEGSSAINSKELEDNSQESKAFLPKRYQTSVILLAQVFLGGALAVILSSMDTITFSVFIKYLPHGLLILFVGATGIMIGGYLMSRVFKWDYLLGSL